MGLPLPCPTYRNDQMRKLILSVTSAAVLLGIALAAGVHSDKDSGTERSARGVVFHDANGNGKRDAGEKGLAGVRVSNGQGIVQTDDSGAYELAIDDDTIIFVIKPRNWRTPLNEHNLPQFYYIHKPAGSPELKYAGVEPTGPLPESVDFPLSPQKEPDQFKAILFGDPQPRDQKEIDWIAHDVVEGLVGTDASFGVTLGDILFDDLSLFESQARSIALLGIPWYNIVGNHDINYDAANDRISNATFEQNFGPAYYSFDYGTVHFLVLDDVEWVVDTPGKRGRYRGGLGKQQIEFIRNDLAGIPDDQLLVVMMHIPLTEVEDRQDLYRLIEKRPFAMSMSAHTHRLEHRFITRDDGWQGPEPHHHFINVTVSGSWWSGATDERQIPHTTCTDGTPNGYSIISFDGTKYALDYRPAGRPEDYQLQIQAPDVVSTAAEEETTIFVNVFNGSSRSRTEMRVDSGDWTTMEHTVRNDPYYEQTYAIDAALTNKPWRTMSAPRPSSHLWMSPLPKGLSTGSHLIQVRSTDMFGQMVSGRRIIRVSE